MKYQAFFLFFVAIIFTNCERKTLELALNNKSIDASNMQKSASLVSPEDYYDFLGQPCNVQVMLNNGSANYPFRSESSHAYAGTYLVGAGIKNNNQSQSYYDNGIIYIGSKSLSYDIQEKQYQRQDYDFCADLFGRVVKFEIPTPHKGLYVDSLYVPQKLFLTSPVRNVGSPTPALDLSNGLAITWQPDTRNYNGILIMVDYPPLPDEPTDRSVTPPYIFAQSVEDNGSFTIPAEVFAKIPAGRRRGAKVTLYRGAFKSIVDDATHATKISGHSSVAIDLSE